MINYINYFKSYFQLSNPLESINLNNISNIQNDISNLKEQINKGDYEINKIQNMLSHLENDKLNKEEEFKIARQDSRALLEEVKEFCNPLFEEIKKRKNNR